MLRRNMMATKKLVEATLLMAKVIQKSTNDIFEAQLKDNSMKRKYINNCKESFLTSITEVATLDKKLKEKDKR
jgi:hypothetical protein